MVRLVIGVTCFAFALAPAWALLATEPTSPSANEKKRDEPDWASLRPASTNTAYLDHLNRVRCQLDAFKHDAHWREALTQMLSFEYTFVGRYKKALECFEELQGKPQASRKSTELANYEPGDALDAIVALADRYQVIMVNEAHHVPLHRAFTIQLLEGLYRKGFPLFRSRSVDCQGRRSLDARLSDAQDGVLFVRTGLRRPGANRLADRLPDRSL